MKHGLILGLSLGSITTAVALKTDAGKKLIKKIIK